MTRNQSAIGPHLFGLREPGLTLPPTGLPRPVAPCGSSSPPSSPAWRLILVLTECKQVQCSLARSRDRE
jgi:hypothetical protein